MARFYGSIQGNRGEATRMGTASSGISAHPRGWNTGVAVNGFAQGDADRFSVSITGGSHAQRATLYDVLDVLELDDGALSIDVRIPGHETQYIVKDGEVTSYREHRSQVYFETV